MGMIGFVCVKGGTMRAVNRSNVLSLCAVVGLAFMSIWSDLVGHGSGLAANANLVEGITNARIIFLAGLASSAICCVAFPRFIRRHDRMLGAIVAIASFTATLLFSFPSLAPEFPSDYLCLVCLYMVGIGYGWLTVHLLCELAQRENYSIVVYLIALSLLAKTVVTSVLSTYCPPIVQMIVAIAAPVIAIAAVWLGQRMLDDSDDTIDLVELPKLKAPDRRVLVVLLVLLPVLRALVRVLSKMGFWGSGYEVQNVIDGLGFIFIAGLLLFFGWITLVKEQGDDLITRFLPPFLVILGGFFLLDPEVSRILGFTEWTSYVLTTFVELFSHLFYWSLIVLAVRSLNYHPYRVFGIAYATFGMCSIAFALLTLSEVTLSSTLIILAMYFFILVMMFVFRSSKRVKSETIEALMTKKYGDDNARYLAIAEQYKLSPRETEVFILLGQGRNRTYIKDSLFIAEGTVKTHISRVYQKLGVNNRQDLITFVEQVDVGEEAAL